MQYCVSTAKLLRQFDLSQSAVSISNGLRFVPYANIMFFFCTCIVIQLCNVNQQMHTFQINVLIQFLVSSTCFEHHVFIIR